MFEGGLDSGGSRRPDRTDDRGVGAPSAVEDDQLAGLPPLAVDYGQLIPRVEGEGARTAARNRAPLHVGGQNREPRDQYRAASGRRARDGWGWGKDHVP